LRQPVRGAPPAHSGVGTMRMGSDEISAAGVSYIHEDQQEREMEYEPDYDND
jgi:hypothetical protein